jgi:hypothetical protein
MTTPGRGIKRNIIVITIKLAIMIRDIVITRRIIHMVTRMNKSVIMTIPLPGESTMLSQETIYLNHSLSNARSQVLNYLIHHQR